VSPDDVGGFAAAICSLIAEPEKRLRLASNAKHTVSRYDPVAITKQVAEVYRELPRLGLAGQARRIMADWIWVHSDRPAE
jgi:hypothetical protein